jgi:hypothetical protein
MTGLRRVPVDAKRQDWPRLVAEAITKAQNDAGTASGTAAWGSITGTLSGQTDLQTALDAKQATDAFLDDIAALTDPGADRMLFWDDSAGEIIFLTAGSGLTIAGTTITADSTVATRALATSDNALITDNFIAVDATTGDVTVTLPAASTATGVVLNVKKVDSSANNVILDGNASETIDGATTLSFNVQYQSFTVVCDGTQWWVI